MRIIAEQLRCGEPVHKTQSFNILSMKRLLPLGLLLLLLPLACTEKESNIGINLEDPMTLYNGKYCSVNFSASTQYDDSLLTVGYTAGVFGNYVDATFGKVNATIFSQIALSSSTGIAFPDSVQVDSVVMTFIIDTALFADDAAVHDLHVVIRQLAAPVSSDSVYYASSTIPDGTTTFFDGHVAFSGDSLHLHMNPEIIPILKQQSCGTDEFLSIAKGFSLRLADESRGLLTVNFSATNTRLVMYYHHPSTPSTQIAYTFVINSDAAHFMNYRHDYSGTVIEPLANGTVSKLDGSQRLYIEPLGGTKLHIDIQHFLDTFCVNHPTAVIHYAQLILPTADTLATKVPTRLLAYSRSSASSDIYTLITDANVISNPYTYGGFDGYYNSKDHQYRMRFTRHLQEMMRYRKDYGTILYIDARRSSSFRTILNGPQADRPAKLEFVYSE